MSIELHATKTRISMLVNDALSAIENRASDASWSQKVTSVAGQLEHLEKTIKSRKTNIQHFGHMAAKNAGHQNAFRVRQSATSKVANMDVLERAIKDALGKIGKQLKKVATISPFEDKQAHELVNMLADELSSYDQLLNQVEALAKEMSLARADTHISVVQRDISTLKSQSANGPGGPSTLMMLALMLRLAAMMIASKK